MEKAKLSDFRRYLLSIPASKAFGILDDVIRNFGAYKVSELDLSEEDVYKREAWYYAQIGAKKEDVVIKTLIDEMKSIIDITIACDTGVVLTGILSKITQEFSKRLYQEEQKQLIIPSGNFRILQCTCGAPLPRLPTKDHPVKCEYCGTIWHYEDIS